MSLFEPSSLIFIFISRVQGMFFMFQFRVFQLSSLNACQGYDYASQDMIIMVLMMQDQVLNANYELGFQAQGFQHFSKNRG